MTSLSNTITSAFLIAANSIANYRAIDLDWTQDKEAVLHRASTEDFGLDRPAVEYILHHLVIAWLQLSYSPQTFLCYSEAP